MNRRFFLAALAGAVIDPDKLLWRTGAKLISIPRRFGLSSGIPEWPGQVAYERPYFFFSEELTLEEFKRRYPSGPSRGFYRDGERVRCHFLPDQCSAGGFVCNRPGRPAGATPAIFGTAPTAIPIAKC